MRMKTGMTDCQSFPFVYFINSSLSLKISGAIRSLSFFGYVCVKRKGCGEANDTEGTYDNSYDKIIPYQTTTHACSKNQSSDNTEN